MVSSRGRANHSLYLGRILLAAWHREAAGESVPAATLSQAYLPAVRAHFADAYGWFLLEITRPEPLPARPPHRCAELPGIARGKALPGEAREFEQLEQSGWLAQMLDETCEQRVSASPDNLATGPGCLGPEDAAAWAEALQALFDRMGDSLDEY